MRAPRRAAPGARRAARSRCSRHRRGVPRLAAAGTAHGPLRPAVTLAACNKGPEVAHPFTGQTRYLCCNLYYDKDKTNDANWQAGTKVPFGTRVHIEHVRRGSIEFTPEGHPTITLVYKYGDKTTPFDAYLDQLFVDTDPHTKLRKVPAKRVEAIQNGQVEKGMTKE